MRLLFAIFLFAAVLLLGSSSPVIYADTIIFNASIITISKSHPRASAIAVQNGKILSVGSNEAIRKVKGPNTVMIDAKGQTIVPGFNDAHLHPSPVYAFENVHATIDLGPDQVKNMDELVAVLHKKALITPAGLPIRGFGYQDTKLGKHPTRDLLDKISTTHPVIIRHSSGHITAVNSYVLTLAGISKDTPDPPGGAFDRNTNGEPNGVCREIALADFFRSGKLKEPAPPTEEEEMAGYQQCFSNYLSHGITSITEAGSSFPKYAVYEKMQKAGLPLRINLLIAEQYVDDVIAKGIKQGYGDDQLRISGIKVFHGNSLTGRTCWLNDPYDRINPETGKKDYHGIPPRRKQPALDSLFLKIHQSGLQIGCHSNGDREIAMVLEAIEKAEKAVPATGRRHRIEHCSVTTNDLLSRILRDSVVIVLHSYIYEHGDKMKDYGPTRWPMMFPDKTASQMGIHVAQHSDAPISAAIPMLRIQSLVTRKSAEGVVVGENQRISAEDAIREWTAGGAYASFEERKKGTLEEGKFADLVILSADPTKTKPDEIKDIKVISTMINGKIVYDASMNGNKN